MCSSDLSNADEMSEEELDLDILEQPNEEVEIGQKRPSEEVKSFEKKSKGKRSQQYGGYDNSKTGRRNIESVVQSLQRATCQKCI